MSFAWYSWMFTCSPSECQRRRACIAMARARYGWRKTRARRTRSASFGGCIASSRRWRAKHPTEVFIRLTECGPVSATEGVAHGGVEIVDAHAEIGGREGDTARVLWLGADADGVTERSTE